ncbi:hypothetical protein UFOVP116_268 [uncultured Caudovirales phage]|uniref:Uncharacterized protein n=1 Tax=uncultured Caudovirales phage TaxID=2100421 RepID=A0A6J5LAN5_9CAUD|nr:hypothetical protein UFOVP116_268 [uncultured Caudovirales phage]
MSDKKPNDDFNGYTSIPLQRFNEKVRSMNQTKSKDLYLSAEDARNLHSELFKLLALLSQSGGKKSRDFDDNIEIRVDGGRWS